MSDGRVYFAFIDAVAVTVEVDLFEILCPTDSVIRILSISVGQETEEGDAQAEMLAYKLVRGEGSVTSGSGGGTVTPTPAHTGFAASGATVETANTTKMLVGTGALKIIHAGAFHVAAGLRWDAKPKCEFMLSPGDRGTVEIAKAPADSITFSGRIAYEEMGG